MISTAGEDIWKNVKTEVGIDAQIVEAANYDDSVTIRLVVEVANETGQSTSKVLCAFGRHLVLFTGREGRDAVFQLAGHDLKSFLMGLDDIHARR
ncbi:MAG: heme NO-binding domain-containing protein [Pseudomonadota bacterium]